MNISLEWLREFLPGELSAERAADALMAGGFPVENIHTVQDDHVLDVEVTSNRGDCLSHLGIGRELSALLDRPVQFSKPAVSDAGSPAGDRARVRIDAADLCPHYTARIITNVRVGPSPEWMQRRLSAIGLRPINNIVDVTNYVMFELGQPLHAFDLDKLAGPEIIVRCARPGEKLLSIDGHERTLSASMLVIADAKKPAALAGVMGGKDSEVTDRTVNILLESARFDALSVRTTARALTMKSDSSYRFERGIDPLLPELASRRAAELILQLAGGQLLTGLLEAGADGYSPKQISLRPEKVEQLLGVGFPTDKILNALSRQHLSPQTMAGKTQISCSIPSWRLDLNIEVDLIEEVARTIGYDAIPTQDEIRLRLAPPQPRIRAVNAIRDALVAAGYYESITFSWVSDLLANDFLSPAVKGLARADISVRKVDGQLRPSLLPGLLESVRRNETAGTPGAKLFEIGSVFWLDEKGDTIEQRRIGLVGSENYRETRGAVELLLGVLNPNKPVHVTPGNFSGFAPNAAGEIRWGEALVGRIGLIDPGVLAKIDLKQVPCAAELDLESVLDGAAAETLLRPLPRFPSVRRDLSLVVADDLAFEKIDSLVRALKPEMMEDLEYVTTYRGKPLEKNQKSVTITLVFRSPSGTLTAEQVEHAVQNVVQAAHQKLGASLRT